MTRIAVITGSTRPGRNNATVAHWIHDIAAKRGDAQFEVVDIADFNLPLFDEAMPPSFGQYANEHTKAWSATIAEFDGFIIVTPEYNHSTSGALKNALDYLSAEWNNKAAGFVGYGSVGGSRAIEHLRAIMAELQVATVRNTVMLSIFTDFENFSDFKPAAFQEETVNPMIDQVIAWSDALAPLRASAA
ncbi:NADPH-dependent FMN reductase [Streptomyces sp. GQFP]|uniref:NADPH-dependent FMN reductase n=1 Tax=Streptomyces sp. GQFP TaxID=2907545 RepID=UPI001F411DB3|nr:NAD(P)H-dependent oxidoreductase [Streptomyces sp. GQFP]UIX31943.1 NAD(P)H-dependent oxidoreductase [Streptomyces sp. GQFP]